MSILQAIFLGIVQGLTEFIPVSSSGHLVVLHNLLGISDGGLVFDVALHFGTLLALIIFFHKDIWRLLDGVFSGGNQRRIAWLLALATVPAVIAGYLLQDAADSAFRANWLVAMNLIIVAGVMLLAEHLASNKSQLTAFEKIKTNQSLAIGLAQAVALIPGVSRSGSTITTGLLTGVDRVAATRFSFLLGIPIMIGAIAKVMIDGGLDEVGSQGGIFIAGIASAFISGLVAIRFLLKYLAKHSLNVFAYYRIAVGLLILLFSVL